jgi:hypothetical protein
MPTMNRSLNRTALWLSPLAVLVLGACDILGGGEPRPMAHVFDDMEDVRAEAIATLPDGGHVGLEDFDDDYVKTLGRFSEQYADLYDELAGIAPVGYQHQLRECADVNHAVADAAKGGVTALMELGLSLDVDSNVEADCQDAVTDLGGPNLSI